MDRTFLSGNNTKAGLPEELSRDRIDQIILEASRNSKFYQHQQKRLQQVSERAKALGAVQYTEDELQRAEHEIEDYLTCLRETAKKASVFVHVDMDAFFAAVEQLHRPELANVPMAVGSEPMLSTANYPARRFGVSAAMPGFIARKLCPRLVIVPLNYDRYVQASEQVHAVFRQFDPHFLSFSLDEASLDFTQYGENVGAKVEEMRALVKSSTGLTCSAGIGPTRQLAKMASNINKPNGQFAVPLTDTPQLLHWLHSQPVKRICGAGKVTCALLKEAYGVNTIGDLRRQQARVWLGLKGARAEFLVSAAHGLAPSMYDGEAEDEEESSMSRKSVSVERTYFPPITDINEMDRVILELSDLLFEDLSGKQVGCSCVSIKVKLSDFQTLTRSHSVGHRVESAKEIYKISVMLLHKLAPASVRLLGVRASALESTMPTLLDAFLCSGVDVDSLCKQEEMVECPCCVKYIPASLINEHLDSCLQSEPPKPKPKKPKGPMDMFILPK